MQTFLQLAQAVEQALERLSLPKAPTLLYEPIRYALQSGGKRVRPVLALMCAELFSRSITKEDVDAMLGIELFHTFTLIHDDIMDRADVRRGLPTVVKKWDANVAILSGDAMLIEAYKLLTRADNAAAILKTFNHAAIEVCEGQQLDVDFEQMPTINEEQYLEMVGKKTAVLLAAAAAIGAQLAGAPAADVEHLYKYAYNVGLAFQLQDDYLDAYSDAAEFGKITGGDIVVGKKTFLFVTTSALLNESERKDFLLLMQNTGLPNEEKIAKVKHFYAKVGVEERLHFAESQFFEKALEALEQVNVPKEHKEELKSLAFALLRRKK